MRGDRPVRPGKRHRRGYVRGPHLFRNRSGTWAAYVPGIGRQSLRTRDDVVANEMFRRLVDRGRAAGQVPREKEASVSEIADAYVEAPHGWTARSLSSTTARAQALALWLRGRGISFASSITDATIDAWIEDRAGVVSRATINRDLVVARRMFAWASGRGLCKETTFARRRPLREPRRTRRRVIASPEDVARTVARMREAGEDGAALTVLAAYVTGLRLDELRHLRPEDVGPDGVWVRPEAGAANDAWTSKGYRERRVPVGEDALRTVREFLMWRRGRGGKGHRIGIAGTWIAKRIDAAGGRFRMHDLRRLFATVQHDAGTPVRVLAQWLGHADVATTERYLAGQARDNEMMAVDPRTIRAQSTRDSASTREKLVATKSGKAP